jgi:ABC-type nickel/cobalt efflux system permease component RcnA
MIQLLTGIAASMAHVITGPDHLAAVTPLAINSRNHAWKIGISWGIGHTTGMLILGGLFLLFKEFIPIEKISAHSEIIVGILLIAIGTWAIFRVLGGKFSRFHFHPHLHTGPSPYVHIHPHSHSVIHEHQHSHVKSYRQNAWTALLVGIVHGLAGFSHLLAVLPTLALPSETDAVLYLGGFAGGTIFTMFSFAFLLGFVAWKSSEKNKTRFLKGFSLGGGILAIGVGIFWILKSL